jgi:hypothetical protein
VLPRMPGGKSDHCNAEATSAWQEKRAAHAREAARARQRVRVPPREGVAANCLRS